jgi:hypothetical protein
MKPATTKPTGRKTMRVATVFTGAVAAAAFAPAAMAATADPGHAAVAGHLAQPESKIWGSIQQTSSCANVPHWLHIAQNAPLYSLCFGFEGRSKVSTYMSAECGGNNYGFLFTDNVGTSFGPGKTFRRFKPGRSLESVVINGWTGNDTCS